METNKKNIMSKELYEKMQEENLQPTKRNVKNILIKLFNVKQEIEPLTKDTTNSYYNSKYFDINALLSNIEPILSKHRLLLLQPIKEGKLVSTIYDLDSGEEFTSSIDLPTNIEPQKMGSALTYYRRYSIVSMLGLQAEDDDGNATIKNIPKLNNEEKTKPWLNLFDKQGSPLPLYNKLVERVKRGDNLPMQKFEGEYRLSKQVKDKLIEIGIK